MRDREIDVVDLESPKPAVVARIPVQGNPNRMVLNHAGSRLYVASDNADVVSVIDTAADRVLNVTRTIAPPSLMAPGAYFHGVAPNSLALSPDESRLYVTNGEENAVAILTLGAGAPRVAGLIPTGYWPNSVSVSADGKTLYIVNGKSVPGPNAGWCATTTTTRHGTCIAAGPTGTFCSCPRRASSPCLLPPPTIWRS